MRFWQKSKVVFLLRVQKHWQFLIGLIFLLVLQSTNLFAIKDHNLPIISGAEQTEKYFPYLKNKRVSLVVNQTSLVGKSHLVDTLLNSGITIINIFSPEHGFRGDVDAGEFFDNTKDKKTGLPLISLYGSKKKPTNQDLSETDILIFDIQDVGARFYTYISTLHYVMEACAENKIELLLLDRPNPNMAFVDGPIMEPEFKSFVGMHPVPILYGMSIGEYAKMINGEYWLSDSLKCKLKIIKLKNLTSRSKEYVLPVPPSPNLPNQLAIKLYASLCLFEGTTISVGRGTYFPFQVIGHPDLKSKDFEFTPISIVGMSKNPPYENKLCYGTDLRIEEKKTGAVKPGLDLCWLLYYYSIYPNNEKFFNNYFEKLAGNSQLRIQIIKGTPIEEIKKSWAFGLERFCAIREKYLLYLPRETLSSEKDLIVKSNKKTSKSFFSKIFSNSNL